MRIAASASWAQTTSAADDRKEDTATTVDVVKDVAGHNLTE